MVASYAFIWPMKRTKQLTNDKAMDEAQAVIQNADNLFENGHYEDSFEILSEFNVCTLPNSSQTVLFVKQIAKKQITINE